MMWKRHITDNNRGVPFSTQNGAYWDRLYRYNNRFFLTMIHQFPFLSERMTTFNCSWEFCAIVSKIITRRTTQIPLLSECMTLFTMFIGLFLYAYFASKSCISCLSD